MEYDLHLFFDPRCYLGRSIFMICKEIRAYVTMRLLDLGNGDQNSEEYLKMNPRGVSPTIYDSPKNVFNNSHAIALFCVNQYESVARRDKLMSFETRFRAKIDELLWFSMDVEHVICKEYLNIWGVVLRGEKPNFEKRQKVVDTLNTLNRYREYYDSKFIITTYYTAPEVFMAFICDQMELCLSDMPGENPLEEFPGLQEWLGHMRAVNSYKLVHEQTGHGNVELGKTYRAALKDNTVRLPKWEKEFPNNQRLKPEKTVL